MQRMGSCYLCRVVIVLVVGGGLLLLLPQAEYAGVSAAPCYPSVFVFGDSLSDTGNGVLSDDITDVILNNRTAQRPYGETVPGSPFNRYSDGLLLVDFLATRLGLPFLNPSLNPSRNFAKGVNYAVASATALNAAYLRTMDIYPLTSLSLDVQIGWHLALKASSRHPRKPTTDAYNKGLYVIEFGVNDYSRALNSLYSPSNISVNFLPLLIEKIRNATEVLYANGARNFLYISVPPLGCSPSLLALFLFGAKDSNGCLRDINTLSFNHGVNLLNLVKDLRAVHSNANFTFVDYYGAYTQVIRNSASYGFSNTLDACCGAGPRFPYKYTTLLFCNILTSKIPNALCPNPTSFLNWDGIHYTHKFNSQIFNLTINTGLYLNPPNAFTTCISTSS